MIEAASEIKMADDIKRFKDKGYKVLSVLLPITSEWVYRRFMESLLGMCAGDAYNWFLAQKIKMVVNIEQDFPICHNRNMGILNARYRWGADYIMQLDTDQTFLNGSIMELFETMKKPAPDGTQVDVVSGMYYMKRPPFRPVLGIYDPKVEGEIKDNWALLDKSGFVCRGECGEDRHKGGEAQIVRWMAPHSWPDDKIWRADVIGVGCVLSRAEVWDKIPFPYFKYSTDPIRGNKFKEMPMISEDMFWCAQMHKAGVKVWIDPKIQCGHIGVLESNRQLYETGFQMTKARFEALPDDNPEKKKFMEALLNVS